jgi:hypothetical protein
MRPIKITEIKVYVAKMRKYEGSCDKKRYGYEIKIDASETGTHEEFLSTLIHELIHACLDLIRNRRLTFLLSKSSTNEGKVPKVVRISESKLDEIEEEMCQETEKAFLKIFRNYRTWFCDLVQNRPSQEK